MKPDDDEKVMLRGEITRLKKLIENGQAAHNEERVARDWLAREKEKLAIRVAELEGRSAGGMSADTAARLERLIVSGDYQDWRAVVECGRELIAEVRRLRDLRDLLPARDQRVTHLEMAVFDAMATLPPGPALDALSEAVEGIDFQELKAGGACDER